MGRQNDAKGLLPVAVGLGFVYLIFNPPEFIQSLGLAGYLLPVAFLFAAILVMVAMSLRSNLPEHIHLSPAVNEPIPEEMNRLVREIESLGFTKTQDTPATVQLSEPALIIPLVSEQQRTYATVYKTGTVPAKISHDFVSFFLVQDGGLTTAPMVEAGVLPSPHGSFKQIFPGYAPTALFDRHKQSMDFLKRRNLEFMPVSSSTFERDFRTSMLRMRSYVLSSLISSSFVALWRTVTKQTPYLGSIQTQTVAQKNIERLRNHQ